MPIAITPALTIDDRAIEERFVRASGPGGQNVNKVATAVQLRFDLARSTLSEDVKTRLRSRAGSRLTSDDVLVIEAREHRTQAGNREAARGRLVSLIRQAIRRPRTRKPTAPTRAAAARRLDEKKLHGSRKASRRLPRVPED